MRTRSGRALAALLLLVAGQALAGGEAPPEEAAAAPEPPGPLYCWDGGCEWPRPLPDRARFVVVELHGEVSLGMAAHAERVTSTLEPGDVLVLDINTFGGRVDAAVRIRDALLRATEGGDVWTVAFIHPRAISAGALISLATDVIAVAPGATIGAATPVKSGAGGEMQPVEEKVVSYMRSEMRSTAESRGRSGEIGEAMVDADVEIPGLIEEGKLLTLDGHQALAWGVASFEARDLDGVIGALGYGDGGRPHEVRTVGWSWAEGLAGWLSSAALSGILMTVGMLALMIGLYTGGSPLPLAIGAVCLGVFFFGHHVVALAGVEEILLFALGIALLAVEAFAPGHIIPGVLGVLLIVASLAMGLVDLDRVPLTVQWEMGWIGKALATVFGSIFATAALAYATFRFLPESEFGRRLFLDAELKGRVTDKTEGEYRALAGASGEVVADLRPSGKVKIAGRRYDAVAVHGYLGAGEEIEVVGARGFSLVVKKRKAEAEPADSKEEP